MDGTFIFRGPWIRTSDSLPRRSWETHELTILRRDGSRLVRTSIFSYETDEKGNRKPVWWNKRKGERVVAWRLLPQAYVEGKEQYSPDEPLAR